MVFSSAVTGKSVFGNKRITWGTFDCASVTTGNIDTGLKIVEFFNVQQNGSAVATNAPVINETFPLQDTDVTIITDSNAAGYWWAFGV